MGVLSELGMLAERPDDAPLATKSLGPAMRALTKRQRAFVVELLLRGDDNHTAAARAAGYKDSESDAGIRVTAYRLTHDPKVLAALKEESERRLRSTLPMAVNVVAKIANDETAKHGDRLKAASMIMNRAGMSDTIEHHHVHEHKLADDELLAEAKAAGIDTTPYLPALPPPAEQVEDAEFSEVELAPDGEPW
jgi:hypothetical protein